MKRVVPIQCVILMVVLVIASCSGKKSLDALEGEWEVVSIGELVVPDSADAFLGFNVADQLLFGYTGCNHLTGTLHRAVDAPNPLFSAVGSTRKWCPDMRIENALLPALSHVVDFSIDGDTLNLLDSEGEVVAALLRR